MTGLRWLCVSLAFCVAGCGHEADSDKEIVAACTDLVLDYALYRDRHDVDRVVDLFSDDATLTLRGQTYEGRDAIRARTLEASQGPGTRHLVSTIRIEVLDDNRATGVSYVTVYAAPADDSVTQVAAVNGFAIVGDYIDEFERTEHGWRIAARRLEPAFLPAQSP